MHSEFYCSDFAIIWSMHLLCDCFVCLDREQYNHALSNKMFTLPLPSSSISDEAAVSGNGEDGSDRRSVGVTYQLEKSIM